MSNNLKLRQKIAQITFSGHRVNDEYTMNKRQEILRAIEPFLDEQITLTVAEAAKVAALKQVATEANNILKQMLNDEAEFLQGNIESVSVRLSELLK